VRFTLLEPCQHRKPRHNPVHIQLAPYCRLAGGYQCVLLHSNPPHRWYYSSIGKYPVPLNEVMSPFLHFAMITTIAYEWMIFLYPSVLFGIPREWLANSRYHDFYILLTCLYRNAPIPSGSPMVSRDVAAARPDKKASSYWVEKWIIMIPCLLCITNRP
jgi:hypothetical protein